MGDIQKTLRLHKRAFLCNNLLTLHRSKDNGCIEDTLVFNTVVVVVVVVIKLLSKVLSHLSDLLLLQVVPLNHDFALEGAAVPVVEHSLLGQQHGLLLGLGVLHVLLVLGQALLLLLLGGAVVLVHLLRENQNQNQNQKQVYYQVG